VVVASFSNNTFTEGYRIGLPHPGRWIIRFNSDWKGYSPDFSDVSNQDGEVISENKSNDGFSQSGLVSIPPYGLLVLSQEEAWSEVPHDNPESPRTE
jgi:1,4-alpha-glucan branching enzyme